MLVDAPRPLAFPDLFCVDFRLSANRSGTHYGNEAAGDLSPRMGSPSGANRDRHVWPFTLIHCPTIPTHARGLCRGIPHARSLNRA